MGLEYVLRSCSNLTESDPSTADSPYFLGRKCRFYNFSVLGFLNADGYGIIRIVKFWLSSSVVRAGDS
jgi:hypothetical protein